MDDAAGLYHKVLYRGVFHGILEHLSELLSVSQHAAKATRERREKMRAEIPPVEHPVVRTHPETGEKILFVNEVFTSHFANYGQVNAGLLTQDAPSQSRDLFATLLRQARTPEDQLRVQWQKDTVVFWDNRAVQHYAINDYYPNVRSMMRATIIGDRPR